MLRKVPGSGSSTWGKVLSLEAARHIQGIEKSKHGKWLEKKEKRITQSPAGLVIGYLQAEALKGLRNSSTERGRERLHYHASKHHTPEIIPERNISALGFEVRLPKFKSQLQGM